MTDHDLPALQIPESEAISVLRNSLYPNAKDESIRLVLAWCKASGKDPMKRPVHIVPMKVKTGKKDNSGKWLYEDRDVLMPGINDYRTDAARTGAYAGLDAATFGPDVTETFIDGNDAVTVTYPEWCEVVAYRIVQGVRCPFSSDKVYWKETYATASRWTSTPNEMWRKRPRGQLVKCFDPETQVLTTHGFERFDSVTGRVLQVTDLGLEPCDAVPFRQDYDGEMIVFDGTRLNFSVTPNHDMITSLGRIEAGEMFDLATTDAEKLYIPRSPKNRRGAESPLSDAQIQLAGYFLADGSASYNKARIAVSRPYKIDALTDLGLHESIQVKRDGGRVAIAGGREIVTQHDKTLFVYDFALLSWLVDRQKHVAIPALLDLSQRQARLLVDAILLFDGSDNGGGTRRLSQKNSAVLRAFEVASVLAGYSVSARRAVHSDIGSSSTITVSDAPHFPVYKAGGVARRKVGLVKRKNVAGAVWCVTVPSGVIVVRRHGFSMLCGNCAEAMALRRAFPEAVGGQPTAEEMEGRVIDDAHTIDAPTIRPPQPKRIEDQTAQQTTLPQAMPASDDEARREPFPASVAANATDASRVATVATPDEPATPGERAHIIKRLSTATVPVAEILEHAGAESIETLTKAQFAKIKARLAELARA